jgi:hypothetical protein
MFEVTKENFHIFLTNHGMNVENAQVVVDKWYNTDNYHKLQSVRLWVDASKMLLRTVEI